MYFIKFIRTRCNENTNAKWNNRKHSYDAIWSGKKIEMNCVAMLNPSCRGYWIRNNTLIECVYERSVSLLWICACFFFLLRIYTSPVHCPSKVRRSRRRRWTEKNVVRILFRQCVGTHDDSAQHWLKLIRHKKGSKEKWDSNCTCATNSSCQISLDFVVFFSGFFCSFHRNKKQ